MCPRWFAWGNPENLNAHCIGGGVVREARLGPLNAIAIQQMRILTGEPGVKRLE